MNDIYTLTGSDLDWLRGALETGKVTSLRVAIDGGAKFSANGGMWTPALGVKADTVTLPEGCQPIPDTRIYRAMREGHLARTGHELVGYLDTGKGYAELVRGCCVEARAETWSAGYDQRCQDAARERDRTS